VLDDDLALARHAHHGEPCGEWTHSTYGWSAGIDGLLWRPLPAFVQHLLALAAGRTPEVFRLLNVALHALVVLAAIRVARRAGAGAGAAALVGCVLVLHPVVPEVVAWSSDVFDLALALVLLGAAARAPASVGIPRRVGEAFAFGLLACFCKESGTAAAPALAALAWAVAGWRAGLAAGAGAAAAAALFLQLHERVTGEGYGGATNGRLTDMALAGLDAVGSLPTLPARATAAHLFEPGALAAAPIGVFVLALFGLAAWDLRGDRPARARWLAAVLGFGALLAPAAPGIPYIGIQASRYLFVPLVWLLAVGAAPLERLASGRRAFALAVVAALLMWAPRTATRVYEFRDTPTLFSAELHVEPDNAYARALIARHRVVEGVAPMASLAMWAEAVEVMPAALQVPNPRRERWDLAQAAFLNGAFPLALAQATRLRTEPGWRPEQLSCLEADALDGMGRHDEASVAAVGCLPGG